MILIPENDDESSRRLVEWVLALPRLLWEVGTKEMIFTEVCLYGRESVCPRGLLH
jgi:hypothetical protein